MYLEEGAGASDTTWASLERLNPNPYLLNYTVLWWPSISLLCSMLWMSNSHSPSPQASQPPPLRRVASLSIAGKVSEDRKPQLHEYLGVRMSKESMPRFECSVGVSWTRIHERESANKAGEQLTYVTDV